MNELEYEVFKKFFPIATPDNFIEKIGKRLHRADWLENHLDLLTRLRKFEKKLDPTLYLACLQSVKRYINSRDFQGQGRYQSTLYFFGGVTITRETPALKELNTKIETLIASCNKITPKATNKTTHKTPSVTTFKVDKFFSEKMYLFGPLALAFVSSVTSVFALPRGICPASGNDLMVSNGLQFNTAFNCTLYKMDEASYAGLEKDYHIFGNVPIECAEFIIFAERHWNNRHIKLQQKYFPLLSLPNDYLLLEGEKSLSKTACKVDDASHKKVTLTKNLICLGWDKIAVTQSVEQKIKGLQKRYDDIIWNKHKNNIQAIIRKLKKLQSFDTSTHQFSLLSKREFEGALTSDIEFVPLGHRLIVIMINGAARDVPAVWQAYVDIFGPDILYPMVDDINKDLTEKSTGVEERNDELIKTFKKLECKPTLPCKRKLAKAGAVHLFDIPAEGRLSNENRISDKEKSVINTSIFSKMGMWAQGANYFKLREYLEGKTYTVLYPKL